MLHLTAYLSDRFNRLIDEPISKEQRKRNLSKNIRLLRLNGEWIPSNRGSALRPIGTVEVWPLGKGLRQPEAGLERALVSEEGTGLSVVEPHQSPFFLFGISSIAETAWGTG